MNSRQKLLSKLYPVIINGGKLIRFKSEIIKCPPQFIVPTPFYSLKAERIDGKEINFEQYRGKKVLIVNTASNCGYTSQYAELQKLYDTCKNELSIIGFPSNDFRNQETGTNEEIASFCSVNYGVDFEMAAKSGVLKNNYQHQVYVWLTHEYLNGWNNYTPSWNFTKYLIDEQGRLIFIFGPGISPLDDILIDAVKQ